jgi:hypothetical protein
MREPTAAAVPTAAKAVRKSRRLKRLPFNITHFHSNLIMGLKMYTFICSGINSSS